MRAMAGEITIRAGAYRCACCGQRVVVDCGCAFERCTSCDGSIFQIDRRTFEFAIDEGPNVETNSPIQIDAIDGDPESRQWSVL